MKYVSVIVDNNTNATDLIYTYACEFDDVCVGNKVRVPFSVHNREIDGFVVAVSDDKPENIKRFKHIISIDPQLKLSEEAIHTASWMHKRYLCRYIEAIKCFLPSCDVKGKTKDPFENAEAFAGGSQDLKLNDSQQKVFDEISKLLEKEKHEMLLLHGVTGSGKTEVYLQSMKKVIDSGRQGIMLVPEIALTPQMVGRFIGRFGKSSVAIIHSKLTMTQRAAQYKRIESGEAKLVIGARSAIFAPFKNIGLIILDEEHETSYKSDKSPKYDTIELAAKRAMEHNALVILGSATPSVNDYYRSEKGVFKRIELPVRYNSNPLPIVRIVDMTKEVRNGNRNLFSVELANAVQKNLDNGKQVILFLNRRGYASYINCRECGYVVKCDECSIAMPYHKDENKCLCHYCGKKLPLPKVCPQCGSKIIGRYGVGTQQVEEKAAELFPGARIERLDLDSVSKKGQLEAVLKRFEKKKTDILIGTQLVAKGLDFDNVGLVGVVSADVTLNIPDFRAAERTFQLLTQAAGRAGRGDVQGEVIIQTYSPENSALINSANHDYKSFYEREIKIRQAAMYPPFADLYQILFMDENKAKCEASARKYADYLRKRLPEDTFVLGPTASALAKQGGSFRYQVLIKSPYGLRSRISDEIASMKSVYENSKGEAKLLTVDINPFSFM